MDILDLKTIDVEFPDLISFIREWDLNISKSRIFIAPPIEIKEGEKVKLDVKFPYVEKVVNILAVPEKILENGVLFDIKFFQKERFVEVQRVVWIAKEIERELRREMEGIPKADKVAEPSPYSIQKEERIFFDESSLSGWTAAKCDEFCVETPIFSGTLIEKPFKNIIIDIYSNRYSGCLRYKSFSEARYFFFSNGVPQEVITFPEIKDEHEFYIVYRMGKMDDSEIEKLFQELEKRRGNPIDLLIEYGKIESEESLRIREERMRYIFSKMLYQFAGSFDFFPGDRHVTYFPDMPFNLPTILFSGVRDIFKNHSPEERAKLKENFNLMYLIRKPDSIIDPEEFKLPKLEQDFLRRILTRSRRLREIFQISPIGMLPTYTMVFGLKELGIIEFTEMAGEASKVSIIERRLLNKEESMKGKGHFEIMEIHWISQKRAVEEAYQKMKKKYGLVDVKIELDKDLIALRDRVMKKIDESYNILRDDHSRRLYRKGLVDKDYILFSADLLAKQGEMFLFKNDLNLALDRFEKAVDLVPESYDYRARLDKVIKLMKGNIE